MTESRVKKFAELLVNYSIGVKPGDWVWVRSSTIAEPLAKEVVEAIWAAGGTTTLTMSSDGILEAIYRVASNEQLEWISPVDKVLFDEADALIALNAPSNSRNLSNIPPEKQQVAQIARRELTETYMRRSAEGSLRWVTTNYPCASYAQEADMSLYEYENFVYGATFVDKDDPIAEWRKVHDMQQKLVDWLAGKKQIEIRGKYAELSLSIEGRPFINSDGKKNMPSGEIFTSPVEDSVNGWVDFTYPAIRGGREVEGVRLEFKDGKVVKATAEKNEEYLISQLDSDDGARILGEWAIGTNYGIQQFTKSILYDEKIGGTMHMAVGAGYPETNSQNKSAIHWDFICDMREDSEILVDGELFYKNGEFQV
ncbi:MAG: aminopeptidase [Chloroflexi bacterium]|nr:MAG: aminopeptidase [Chloroflexota bacterium]MBL1196998.1 aminopeptidase [Chloroflexota bacterium]NOH14293.1 aminopeptidase [Chloroflexota bacterium]